MNRPFTILDGIAAPLAIANIDTDMLFPAAFLKTVSRAGLGPALFHTQRFDADGQERPDFILNQEPWRDAQILITRDNLGCGSSREHAPWALLDFGIRCVIAPSIADIFHGNCFKNGMLPIALPADVVDLLLLETANPMTARLLIDLEAQRISCAGGETFSFTIDPARRAALLDGSDEISLTLKHGDAIERIEKARAQTTPWVLPAQDLRHFLDT